MVAIRSMVRFKSPVSLRDFFPGWDYLPSLTVVYLYITESLTIFGYVCKLEAFEYSNHESSNSKKTKMFTFFIPYLSNSECIFVIIFIKHYLYYKFGVLNYGLGLQNYKDKF